MRRSAMEQFLDGLSEGDPFALGLLGFVVVLALIAGVIWFIDQKAKKQENSKSQGGKRGR